METTITTDRPPATPEEIWAILREVSASQKETDRIIKESAERQKEIDRIMKENAERQKDTDRQIKETDRIMKENAEQQKETDRIMKESAERQKETDRQIQENTERQKETDLQMQENEERQKEIDRKMKEENAATVERLEKRMGKLTNTVGYLIEVLIAAQLWEKFPEYNLQRAYRRLPLFDKNNKAKAEIDILLVNSEWAMAVEVKTDVDKGDVDHHIERMSRILQYPPAQFTPGVKLLGAMAGGVVPPEVAAYAHQCGFFVLELSGYSVIRVPAPADFKPKEW